MHEPVFPFPPEVTLEIVKSTSARDPRNIQVLQQLAGSCQLIIGAARENDYTFRVLHIESIEEVQKLYGMLKANRKWPVSLYAHHVFVNGIAIPSSTAATRTVSSIVFASYKAYTFDLKNIRLSLANRRNFSRATTLNLSNVSFAGNKTIIHVLQCFQVLDTVSLLNVDYGKLGQTVQLLPASLRRLHLSCSTNDQFLEYLARLSMGGWLQLTHLSLLNVGDGLEDDALSVLSTIPASIEAIAIGVAFGSARADHALSSFIVDCGLPIASYNNSSGTRDLVFHT